jgi:hypothetical protein
MPPSKYRCPGCRSLLEVPRQLPATLHCPQCGKRTALRAGTAATKEARLQAGPEPGPALALWLAAGGVGFLLVLGVALLAYLLAEDTAPEEAPVASSMPALATVPAPAPVPPPPFEPQPKEQWGPLVLAKGAAGVDLAARLKSAVLAPGQSAAEAREDGLSSTAAPAGSREARVNEAIRRGVVFLKAALRNRKLPTAPAKGEQPPLPVTYLSTARPGTAALVGLALLAAGVPRDDPAVAQVIQQVRREGRQLGGQNLDSSYPTGTYDVATCIWFLDRLGDAADRDLLRSLGLQLVAGQRRAGGWSYNSPPLAPGQEEELLRLLRRPPPGAKRRPKTPPSELADLPVFRWPASPTTRGLGKEDNSNTQFAILALWAAQKYGVPAGRSLAFAEARFRVSQKPDGTWSYRAGKSRDWPDSMTCAGLLGLAVGHGALPSGEGPRPAGGAEPARDPAIERGLLALGRTVGTTGSNPGGVPRENAPLHERLSLKLRGRIIYANAWGDLYYLWSLERVAVVYNLRTIGGKDWYGWGAELLVNHQDPDGRWSDCFPGEVDTSFALLFLKRVNVVEDLTERLLAIGLAQKTAPELNPLVVSPVSPGRVRGLGRPEPVEPLGAAKGAEPIRRVPEIRDPG